MFSRRGFLKAIGIGAVAVVAAPLMPLAPAPVKACRCGKPHGKPKYSTKEQMIADLVDNAIRTHDDAIEAALYASIAAPGIGGLVATYEP